MTAHIAYLEDLLASPRKILALIQSDLNELAEKFGDARRTHIDYDGVADIDEADLVRDEEVLISLTQRGYIKRTPSALYRAQHRGGRGVTGMKTRDEDMVEHLISANSLAHLLFFTNLGKVYALRSYQLPETDRNGKGTLINSLIALEPDEVVTAMTWVENFESGNFVLCTRNAKIKRVESSEFASVRSNGLIAMGLEDDDRLQWVKRTSGNDHIIIATALGQSIRFHEDEVRVMGRQAGGVNAIRLLEDDYLAGVDVINGEVTELLIVTANGYAKRTPIEEYRLQGRFGQGTRTINADALNKLGKIVSMHTLRPGDEITVITRDGMALRTRADTIRLVSRNTQGVRLIKPAKGDQVVSVAVVGSSSQDQDMATNGHVTANGHVVDDSDLLELPDMPLDELDRSDDGANGDSD